MSRHVRLPEPLQPTLPLGHGPVHWDTLPSSVRERVLALWLQLLAEHLAHAADSPRAGALSSGGATSAIPEGRL